MKLGEQTTVTVALMKDTKYNVTATKPYVEVTRHCSTMNVQVFGMLKCTADGTLMGEQPLLMLDTATNGIYAYDGKVIYQVAENIQDMCQNGVTYPSKIVKVNETAVNHLKNYQKQKDQDEYAWTKGEKTFYC